MDTYHFPAKAITTQTPQSVTDQLTWRFAIQWGLFPFVLVLAGLASLAIYHGLVPPMAAQMGIFAIALLAVIAAEHVIPFERRWRQTASIERRVDATSLVMLMTLIDPMLKQSVMPLLLSLTVTVAHPGGGLGWFPTDWPVPAQLLLAAVIAEFGQYAVHRAAHSQRWMWGVHSFHHSPPRLYWLNGFRVNPLNVAWHKLSGLFMLMLIGAPASTLHMLILFGTVVSVFQHANADLRYNGWNLFLSTADLHRWHHSADRQEGHCNFGSLVMVWDRLLGTYRRPLAQAPAQVGVEGLFTRPDGYLRWLRRSTGLG
jgi:sterol desaturase/sphingolipid hydroxylase (fatty acid hydroxylase superfamily)